MQRLTFMPKINVIGQTVQVWEHWQREMNGQMDTTKRIISPTWRSIKIAPFTFHGNTFLGSIIGNFSLIFFQTLPKPYLYIFELFNVLVTFIVLDPAGCAVGKGSCKLSWGHKYIVWDLMNNYFPLTEFLCSPHVVHRVVHFRLTW